MPRINARNMAEVIALPAYAQLAMLTEQKYPKQGASQFKRPYYAPAVSFIRAHYRNADKANVAAHALAALQTIKSESRRTNLTRAIETFRKSPQAARVLAIQTNSQIQTSIGGVDLRASPDLIAKDAKDKTLLLYYNLKAVALDKEVARRIAEIAHWLCEENEIEIDPAQIEIVDITGGALHRTKTRRASTIRQMKQTAKVIETLWDQL